ncbi:exodeoxyribonuclease V subunit alpha [Methylomarinum vadi]|uniref:exodeoxyribonuclease V subunit alpha n=1 Tax=Methylomarinum vadi TaxID=438855 RepID=UPI000691628D|nr:exodeoxyribonuclease V subunit alpha [Methylomarinum vadi]
MNSAILKKHNHNSSAMIELLESWVRREWLRPVDLALTRFLWEENRDAAPELLLATALISHQLGRGHVCLDLRATLDDPYMALSLPPDLYLEDAEDVGLPSDLLSGLSLSAWAEKIGHDDLVGEGHGNTPLVFDGERLYLRRYWQYERGVESAIEQRLKSSARIREELSEEKLRLYLSELFPAANSVETDWQKVACVLAATSAFSVITGGPGTGKTTTVVKLLVLLQRIALNRDRARPLRIRLAAPTGKAAARLKESIAGAIDRLPVPLLEKNGLRDSIPTEVITLHRLLGSYPNSRRFRHDARNPLALDVLVVDEASMVDLEMMAALLSALPDRAHLLLLGDKDQLASVEAGSVLGQLCRRAKDGHFTENTVGWIKNVSGETVAPHFIDEQGLPLDQHIVMLRKSYRFTSHSGIGQLAAAVNAGDGSRIDTVWGQGYEDLAKNDLSTIDDPIFEQIVLGNLVADSAEDSSKGYGHYLSKIQQQKPAIDASKAEFDAWAGSVLAGYSRFQLLCALRKGPFGVEGLNQRVVEILKNKGLIRPSALWYEGRPVLVSRNDYRLGLMNGDIGITLGYPQRDKKTGKVNWVLRVAFPQGDGNDGIRWILPSRLLSVETVFALTVHKSQGSEFEHCALLLPPKRNPVLTRELVYTGITRAKKWFSLISVGNAKSIKDASARIVLRSGGLFKNGF